ncbi:unnamed protein product [Sphagnum troendelagicum]|uniref:Uncharacterized protein n=1 Tax=Sphagnum troendelagicum TaxID=128251 RepID=A0ABP0TQW5_9BRYO
MFSTEPRPGETFRTNKDPSILLSSHAQSSGVKDAQSPTSSFEIKQRIPLPKTYMAIIEFMILHKEHCQPQFSNCLQHPLCHHQQETPEALMISYFEMWSFVTYWLQ